MKIRKKKKLEIEKYCFRIDKNICLLDKAGNGGGGVKGK